MLLRVSERESMLYQFYHKREKKEIEAMNKTICKIRFRRQKESLGEHNFIKIYANEKFKA